MGELKRQIGTDVCIEERRRRPIAPEHLLPEREREIERDCVVARDRDCGDRCTSRTHARYSIRREA